LPGLARDIAAGATGMVYAVSKLADNSDGGFVYKLNPGATNDLSTWTKLNVAGARIATGGSQAWLTKTNYRAFLSTNDSTWTEKRYGSEDAYDIAISSNGSVYIADYARHYVSKFGSSSWDNLTSLTYNKRLSVDSLG
jgi:hypothetical protein